MARKEFSAKTKLAGWERSKGNCEKCGLKLAVGKFRYDHIIPDQLGGDNSLENLQVICTGCDGEKTYKKDIPLIAKSNRIRNRHLGIKKTRRGKPLPGGRDSEWKRKISGEWVRR